MKRILFTLVAVAFLSPVTLHARQAEKDFKQQFMQQARENAAAEAKVTASLLRKKYNGDAAMEKALYQVLYESKIAIGETSMKYAKTPELEARLAEVIALKDSVTDVYIQAAKNKGIVNNKLLRPEDKSKFASAVRIRKELALTPAQVDSLMVYTNKLADIVLNDVTFSPKDYERDVLPKILNDNQYTDLVVSLNKPQSMKYALADWKELKQRGLLPGADSAKVVTDLYNYNISKLSTTDRYGSGGGVLSTAMKAIQVPEPQASTVLKTARKYNNPIPDQKPAFRW